MYPDYGMQDFQQHILPQVKGISVVPRRQNKFLYDCLYHYVSVTIAYQTA